MFLRQVPMNTEFVSGETTYTRVGGDQIKDENGVVTTMSKNTVVELPSFTEDVLFTGSPNTWNHNGLKEDTTEKDDVAEDIVDDEVEAVDNDE
jgi:hypothetical protein